MDMAYVFHNEIILEEEHMPKLYNLTAQFDATDSAFITLKEIAASIGFAEAFGGASSVNVYYSANHANANDKPTKVMGLDIPAAEPSRKLQVNIGSNWIILEEKGAKVELSGFAGGFLPTRQYLSDGSIEDGNGTKVGQDKDQTRNRAVSTLDSIPQFLIASL